MSDYNYASFNMMAERPKFEAFAGRLHVGERAPDFPLADLATGETVHMKDLWRQGLVIAEFGSFTWPYCTLAAEAMDAIADRHADRAVRSVFIYTREAHPGEHYRHHSSMADKRHHAEALRDVVGVRRRILLDDLDGAAHKGYGELPNMTWIFGRGGLILYKSAWTDPADIERSLTRAIDGLERRVKGDKMPFYSERLSWRVRDDETFRTLLERCGPQAVSDFFDNRPKAAE